MRASIVAITCFLSFLSLAQNDSIATQISNMEREVTLNYSDLVSQYITQQTSTDRNETQDALNQFLPYDQKLRALFIESGVPEELRYLALSYFLDNERTSAAAGPFFLSKSQALENKLNSSSYVDERLDLMKAAKVFCGIIGKQNIATYGWPTEITSLVLSNSESNKSYSELTKHLPYNQSSVYPKYVAAVYIAKLYESLGFISQNQEATEQIQIAEYTTLYQLSRALDTDYRQLKSLNPTYIKEIVPNDGESHQLTVPAGAANRFTVLGSKAYDYTATKVYTATELKMVEVPVVDTSLMTDRVLTNEELYGDESLLSVVTYAVRNGDMLLTIADLFDCEVVQLKRWNSLRNDYLDINQELIIKVVPEKRAYYQQLDKMTTEQRKAVIKRD